MIIINMYFIGCHESIMVFCPTDISTTSRALNTLAKSSLLYVSFGQGSSLLWTHTLRPFYSRPTALTQEGRSLVNDVCECVRD